MAGDLESIVSVRIDSTAARQALAQLNRDFDRATMYGLRAAGRVAKQAGRREAPVYKGTDKRAVPGRLKASISSTKRLRRTGQGAWVLRVAPHGAAVRTYRSRVGGEGRYMQDAYEQAKAQMQAKFEAAYNRTLQKAGRRA